MNCLNFFEDPADLADAPNEDDDPIYTNHPILIKSSLYYDFEEFLSINSSPQFYNNFSVLSFNIHSLHGKYEEFRDFLLDIPYRFSIICLQELWSVSCEYPLVGYQAIKHNTPDALQPTLNHNCGGGVGMYISEHLTYSKLELPNSFVPGIF